MTNSLPTAEIEKLLIRAYRMRDEAMRVQQNANNDIQVLNAELIKREQEAEKNATPPTENK